VHARLRAARETPSAVRVSRLALCSVVALAWLVLALPAPVAGETLRRLEYRVAWNGIPAARGAVTITPGELDGRAALVVDASARTNAIVSLLWSFAGELRATMLADGLAPRSFEYRRDLNGTPHATTIDFDDTRARGVYVHGASRRELDVPAEVVDPVTAVFRARGSDAGPGDVLWHDVWTGEVRYMVRLDIRAREEIDVPAGRFAALKVVPHLWRIEGRPAPDTRLRRATIWVTDDPRHIPLRIRSKVFVGAVDVDLVDFAPRG
jgi:hypothetical protein